MGLLIDFFRGVAIGLANIIPGVSGGTMALVLGIYERLIGAVKNIGSETFRAPLRGWGAIKAEIQRIDGLFLAALGLGAVAAIVGTAKLMVYLLNYQHDPTYGFFFGLVLVSVLVPWRMIRVRGASQWLSGFAAIVLVVGVTVALSGDKQVNSARHKAKIEAAKKARAALATGSASTTKAGALANKHPKSLSTSPGALLLFFIAGVVAISAMILPGISGSFVLLLMGVYFDVLTAINERNLLLLVALAAGCGIGLVAFTRLINFMLKRFHDVTMAFLTGLVVGSLYAIWPFKSFEIVVDRRVDKFNILPQSFGTNELLTIATLVAGCAIVGIFLWFETKGPKGETARA